jgi:hypothetical protein
VTDEAPKKTAVKANPWTAEKLSALDSAHLKTVRDNALRLGADELVVMCDSEINSRKKAAPRTLKTAIRAEAGDIVTEYHFVCRNDRGVTFNSDGTFWSTSWVAAEEVVKTSIQFGARLALHNSKLEPSYRQGVIKEYRRVDDFAEGKVESRIDFLVLSEPQELKWAGTGTGEKGYKRVRSSGDQPKLTSDVGDVS